MNNAIQLQNWQKAEDAFLNGFSKIKRLNWGDVYVWNKHPEWPKFSFIRIRESNVNPDELYAEVSLFKKEFNDNAMEFYLRVPRELEVSSEILKGFKKDPDSIVSVSYNPAECGDVKPVQSLDFKRCQTESELRLWWEVNSDARERKNPFKSALWPYVQKKFTTGTEYYLLWKGQSALTCGAIEHFDGGCNSWGLGTRQSEQKKGYSRAYMTHLAQILGPLIYSQVDLGEPRHALLTRLPSTRILATEDLYVF